MTQQTPSLAAQNAAGIMKLNESPAILEAPAPSGAEAAFKWQDNGKSITAQLAEFAGRNDVATSEIAKTAAFTNDGLERKNQERVKAFLTGPTFPIGTSGGEGANTLQPFVNAFFNKERLNSGTPVRPELGAPIMRSIGNAFGHTVNASNWDQMAQVITGQANVDPAGFGQINHTGEAHGVDVSAIHLERGGLSGGPMSWLGGGGPNAGAVFNREDGAANGEVGFSMVAAQQAQGGIQPFWYTAPSGAGALETPNAYGLSAFAQL